MGREGRAELRRLALGQQCHQLLVLAHESEHVRGGRGLAEPAESDERPELTEHPGQRRHAGRAGQGQVELLVEPEEGLGLAGVGGAALLEEQELQAVEVVLVAQLARRRGGCSFEGHTQRRDFASVLG